MAPHSFFRIISLILRTYQILKIRQNQECRPYSVRIRGTVKMLGQLTVLVTGQGDGLL